VYKKTAALLLCRAFYLSIRKKAFRYVFFFDTEKAFSYRKEGRKFIDTLMPRGLILRYGKSVFRYEYRLFGLLVKTIFEKMEKA